MQNSSGISEEDVSKDERGGVVPVDSDKKSQKRFLLFRRRHKQPSDCSSSSLPYECDTPRVANSIRIESDTFGLEGVASQSTSLLTNGDESNAPSVVPKSDAELVSIHAAWGDESQTDKAKARLFVQLAFRVYVSVCARTMASALQKHVSSQYI